MWDRQWFMIFHDLRDGTSLPIRPLARWFKYQEADVSRRLRQLEKMDVVQYWADFLSQEPSRPRHPKWEPPRLTEYERQVERLHSDEITWLKQNFDRKRIEARSQGLKVWSALWRAHTIPALADACKRWIVFHDLRSGGDPLGPGPHIRYPVQVLDHVKQFLAMKKDRRFPRSEHADDARLDYLSRGMAGLHIGISPLTAIERLRNLKHGPGGLLWNESDCSCWRCFLLKDRRDFHKLLDEA